MLQRSIFFLDYFIEMQRCKAENCLTMLSPGKDRSESSTSDDDSIEEMCESP
jgi:hypothetical protein